MKDLTEWFTIDSISFILMFIFVEHADLIIKWVGILALAAYNISKAYTNLMRYFREYKRKRNE